MGFVIISFLAAFLIGGFVLGKNNASKQVPQTPTSIATKPTPTADPTWQITDSEINTGWKKYTNTRIGFSVEYPANDLIAEPNACSSKYSYNLGLFKKNAKEEYLCGSDEPYYFYVNVVNDKSNISADNSCYTNTKQSITVNNTQAEKYTTTFRKEDKACAEAGIGPISAERISIYITQNGKLYLLTWPVLDVDDSIYNQMLFTFKFTDSEDGVACTQDAMQCPDGTWVGRTGPNCEFTECPTK